MSQKNSLSSFQYDDTDPPATGMRSLYSCPPSHYDFAFRFTARTLIARHYRTSSNCYPDAVINDRPKYSSFRPFARCANYAVAYRGFTINNDAFCNPRPSVVIPGMRKRKRLKTTEELKSVRRVSPHLRFGIALGAIIAVMITDAGLLDAVGWWAEFQELFSAALSN